MLKVNRLFIGALLVLSIVFPTTLIGVKFFLFLGVLILSFSHLISNPVRFSKDILLIWFLFPLIGALYSVYGFVVGNPGALRVLTVMFLYPLLFPVICLAYVKRDEARLLRIFILAACILVAIDGFFIFSSLYWPGNLFFQYISSVYEDEAIIDNTDSYFKFALPNISSLVFLIPFFIPAILNTENKKQRIILYFIFIGMCVLAVLSARRALFVAMLFGPLAAYFLVRMVRKKSSIKLKGRRGNFLLITLSIIVILAGIYYSNLFEFYFEQMSTIFNFESDASNLERSAQFGYLIDEISKYPFFGSGAGATAGYSRSFEQPWAYELSYVALIFQYGVFGFLVYLFGILLLVRGLLRSIEQCGKLGFAYFFLSGFLSFLVANATNPYLGKFDYMWVIFIPFAIFVNGMNKKDRGAN